MRKICHLVVSNLGGLKNLEGIADALKPPPPPVKRTQKGPDTTIAAGMGTQVRLVVLVVFRKRSLKAGWMDEEFFPQ